MKDHLFHRNILAATIGTAALGLGMGSASLFAATDLSQGYQLNPSQALQVAEGRCGGGADQKKSGEGSCGGVAGKKSGEGSCGGTAQEKSSEGSCGEGRCGGASGKATEEEADKGAEGKCGEGRCGGR
jgi:uncharacterized low-complexity protein